MDIRVVPATADDAGAWDSFVEQHPEGRFCFLFGYRRMLEGYGYRCVYLKVLAEGQIVGVFPSIIAGRRLISQPFIEYGGVLLCAESAHFAAVIPELLFRAAREAGCSAIEIRGGLGADLSQSRHVVRHPQYSYAVLTLDDKDKLWRNSLTSEGRKAVNKAQKAGLIAEIRRGPAAISGEFYDLYLVSMKRLGVPPHPRRFFTDLAAGLGDNFIACWVLEGNNNAAVLLGGISGQRLQVYITASSPRYWNMRPNDFAHWQMIVWAAEQRLRWLDFGSARYESQIQFKKKWGVTLSDYSYWIIAEPGGKELSQLHTFKTSSDVMQTISKIWGKAVPLRLSPFLGAPIRKYLTK